MPRHRCHTLCSAHRHSLLHQRRRHQHVLATPLHFAPRQQKHSIKWLLKQTQILPPDISAPTPDAHHNDDKSSSSTIHEQIDLYLSAIALILDDAICDFEHDQKQQHLPPDQHDTAATAPPHQQNENDSTPPNLHADRITTPQRPITRSMTASAQRQNTVCILDTDTNPHIPHETTTATNEMLSPKGHNKLYVYPTPTTPHGAITQATLSLIGQMIQDIMARFTLNYRQHY